MKTPYASRRPVANTVLVRQRDRRRRRELALVVMAVLPLALGLLGYAWLHLETLATGYRIEALERRLHALDRQRRELRLDAASLARPERVERVARETLGMGEQRLEQTVYWEEIR